MDISHVLGSILEDNIAIASHLKSCVQITLLSALIILAGGVLAIVYLDLAEFRR